MDNEEGLDIFGPDGKKCNVDKSGSVYKDSIKIKKLVLIIYECAETNNFSVKHLFSASENIIAKICVDNNMSKDLIINILDRLKKFIFLRLEEKKNKNE